MLRDLRALRQEQGTGGFDRSVFQGPGRWTSTAPAERMDRNTVSRRWHKEALMDAALRDMPLHSLRHTAAAAWLTTGKPLMYVQRQFGRASITTTEACWAPGGELSQGRRGTDGGGDLGPRRVARGVGDDWLRRGGRRAPATHGRGRSGRAVIGASLVGHAIRVARGASPAGGATAWLRAGARGARQRERRRASARCPPARTAAAPPHRRCGPRGCAYHFGRSATRA